jgi:hypothetical protein
MGKICAAIFVMVVFFSGYGLAQDQVPDIYGSVYSTYIDYDHSELKNRGWAINGYTNIKKGLYHQMEIGLARTHIDYKTLSDIDQTDFTIRFSDLGQLVPNYSLNMGFHYIDTDDDVTDEGKIFFGQATYFVSNIWNAGVQAAYSIYEDTRDDLSVVQIAPHIGYFYGSHPENRLYFESELFFIHTTDDIRIGNANHLGDREFLSFQQSVTYTYDAFHTKLYAWVGEQVFAVKNSGFVVYNLSDKYKGGMGIDTGYSFKNDWKITLNISREKLKHIGFSDSSKIKVATVSVGKKF